MRLIIVGFALAAALGAAAAAQVSGKPSTLQCKPAPCALPPTLASEGTSLVTDTPIAADPKRSEQLLLGSVDYNCTGGSVVGFHLSNDGGSSWTRVDCMPIMQVGKRREIAVDEPSVGYDQKGNAYASGAYWGGGRYGAVGVQKSSDGNNWGEPVPALYQLGDESSFYLTHMSVDVSPTSRWPGAAYVSGVLVSHGGADNQVWVSHSDDGGSTWTQAAVDAVQKSPDTDAFTRTATSKDGTVYVTWLTGRRARGPVMLSMSADGGNAWSAPQQIAEVTVADSLPHTGERVYDYPSIAVDNSNGPYAGNIYVVMYTYTGSYLKVQMIRSTDGGTTWSEPLPLAPKSDTHDQFFPAISVNKDGLVGVSWLDRRNDPNDIDYQAFAAISYDGGKSFGPNWQLTQAFSDPEKGSGNNWMGDYTGNTWSGAGEFIAAWMDSSFSAYLQEAVGGVRLK